jgi:5,10-methenyltetrahydrofolate synthetase
MQPDDTMQDEAGQRAALRSRLVAARQAMSDRLERSVALQSVLRVWLVSRRERAIGAYWPIKGEFDPLPALYRWTEGAPDGVARQIGLPVAHRESGSLRWHVWYPGCPTELDAYDIPKPKDTAEFEPDLIVVPCLGFGPGGVRLGYGGGFFERTLQSLPGSPFTVGVCFTHGFQPLLLPGPTDVMLDAMLTEDGVMWQNPNR